MPKHYKVKKLSASARRPSTRSDKVRHVKGRVTLWLLALVIAVVGNYAIVRYARTDHIGGDVEIVVGSQLMACLDAETIPSAVTVTEALEQVSVRPTSMQLVILSGPDFNVALPASDLDALYLISGEKEITLTDNTGADLGTISRIYLPIDE